MSDTVTQPSDALTRPEPAPDLLPAAIPAAQLITAEDVALYIPGQITKEEDKWLVAQARMGDAKSFAKAGEGDYAIRLVVGHFGKEVEGDGGEVLRLKRWVFVTDAGEMLSTSGRAAPAAVALMRASAGDCPWDDPVIVRVRLKPTGQPEPAVIITPIGRKSKLLPKTKGK